MRVQPDKWLSGVLGVDCFRVSLPRRQDGSTSPMAQDGLAAGFYFAKVPTCETACLHGFCASGFRVVDVNVTLERFPDATAGNQRPLLTVGLLAPHHHDAVREIAGSFAFSRFHLDWMFPTETAHRVKRQWITSYLDRRRGECLYVAELEGRPVGFLASLAARLAGKNCRVIDLIATHPDSRGKGVGRSLVETFIRDSAGKYDLLRVGTQIANVAAMRLYEDCGFRLAGSDYVLHLHVQPKKQVA